MIGYWNKRNTGQISSNQKALDLMSERELLVGDDLEFIDKVREYAYMYGDRWVQLIVSPGLEKGKLFRRVGNRLVEVELGEDFL